MPDETPEEIKLKIAEKYEEMQKNELITEAAKEVGVSEATFHKYKNHKPALEIQKEEPPADETKDFQDEYKPDKTEEEEEEENNTIYFD